MARRRGRHAAASLAPSPDPFEQRHPVIDVKLGCARILGHPSLVGERGPGSPRQAQRCERAAFPRARTRSPRGAGRAFGDAPTAAGRRVARSRAARRRPTAAARTRLDGPCGRAGSPTEGDQRSVASVLGATCARLRAASCWIRTSTRVSGEPGTIEDAPQDPGPRPEWKVPHDAERLPRQGNLQSVAADDRQPPITAQIIAQERCQRGVELDRDHPAGALEQGSGQALLFRPRTRPPGHGETRPRVRRARMRAWRCGGNAARQMRDRSVVARVLARPRTITMKEPMAAV